MATYGKLDEGDVALASEFNPNSGTWMPKRPSPNTSSDAKAPPDLTEKPVHSEG
jgi:hypothetical protein